MHALLLPAALVGSVLSAITAIAIIFILVRQNRIHRQLGNVEADVAALKQEERMISKRVGEISSDNNEIVHALPYLRAIGHDAARHAEKAARGIPYLRDLGHETARFSEATAQNQYLMYRLLRDIKHALGGTDDGGGHDTGPHRIESRN